MLKFRAKNMHKMLDFRVKNAFFFRGLHPLDPQAPHMLAENPPSGDFLALRQIVVLL